MRVKKVVFSCDLRSQIIFVIHNLRLHAKFRLSITILKDQTQTVQNFVSQCQIVPPPLSCDPSSKDGNARFTTVPLKAFSDQGFKTSVVN